MEEQTAKNEPAAAVSLDWKNLFDSVEREIGTELVKDMAEGGDGIKIFEAEKRFLEEIEPRLKVGKTVGEKPYPKKN